MEKTMTDDGKFFYQINENDELYLVSIDDPLAVYLRLTDEQFAEVIRQSEEFNAVMG